MFGNDVACTCQRLVGVLHAFRLVDVGLCQLLHVALILLHQRVGQRLQSFFHGHAGAGFAFGLVGQVEVLQFGQRGGVSYLLLQLGRQLALFADTLQYGFTAFVELFQLQQHVADGGNLHLVEVAGHLLAVAGDERYGGTLFQQFDGVLHLTYSHVDLMGYDIGVVHCCEL